MATRLAEPYPEAYRASLRRFLDGYLRRRSEDGLVGEFLDDEGIRGAQYGLAGTCFALHMAREEGIEHPVTRRSTAKLNEVLNKRPNARNQVEAHLVKDVGRLSVKTATLLLVSGSRDQKTSDGILDFLLVQGMSGNGLIKPVLDNEAADGEAITTAHTLHLIHISGCNLDARRRDLVYHLLPRLRDDMLANPYPIMTKLLISSALCLFDFEGSIEHHNTHLKRLFLEKESIKRAFSSDAPFLDRWFEDTKMPRLPTRNRYTRLPRGYVVLVSLYVALGDERTYFAFPLVKSMLAEIEIPYSNFAGAWKSRSAVYFVFFVYAALKPKEYFRVPKSSLWNRWKTWHAYRFGELTMFGKALLVLFPVAILATAFVASDYLSGDETLPNLLTAIGFLGSTVLGLLRIRKE